jgi:hypothetical protein
MFYTRYVRVFLYKKEENMIEADAIAVDKVCEMGSFILVNKGKVDIISSDKDKLLQLSALGQGLVYQLCNTDGTPFLNEITFEAKGKEY